MIPFTFMKFLFILLCAGTVMCFVLAVADLIICWWYSVKTDTEEDFINSDAPTYFMNFQENLFSGIIFLVMTALFKIFCEVLNVW